MSMRLLKTDHSRISAPTSLQKASVPATSRFERTGFVQKARTLVVWRYCTLLKIYLTFTVTMQKAGNMKFISTLVWGAPNSCFPLSWRVPSLWNYRVPTLSPILPHQTTWYIAHKEKADQEQPTGKRFASNGWDTLRSESDPYTLD